MQTAITISFHGLELRCGFTPGDKGQFGGGPDRWRQPEGCEVEIESVKIEDVDEWADFDGMVPSIPNLIRDYYDAICSACEREMGRG